MNRPTSVLRKINGRTQQTARIRPAPRNMSPLQIGDLHLWLVQVVQFEYEFRRWSSLLSSDERERANRFKSPQLARRFIIRRGILRLLLGDYCECDPSEIQFSYNPYGKPCVLNNKIQFNTSHAEQYSIIALTWDRQVGVDIEAVKPISDFMQVCAYYFSAKEQAEIYRLPKNLRLEAFYNAWTRKEAFIKATGYGLTFGLKNFSVRATPGLPAALLSVDGNEQCAKQWRMENLPVPEGWRAAVAYQPPIHNVTMNQVLLDHLSIRS